MAEDNNIWDVVNVIAKEEICCTFNENVSEGYLKK